MKILIVDDSNFSQKTTSNILKKFLENVDLYFANDGQAGFKAYKEINPNYIFVDLLMPNLNGQELIRLIKEYDTDARIFVLTADVQISIKDEVEQHGIMSFINKPFNEEKAKLVCGIIKDDLK